MKTIRLPQLKPERPIQLQRVLVGSSVAFAFVLCAMAGSLILTMRENAWSQAERTSQSLLRSVERTLDRDIELYDLSLQTVVERLQNTDLEGAPPEVRQLGLFDGAAKARGFGAIFVLDQQGQAYIDSGSIVPRRLNAFERNYFQVHRARADLGLHIGRPMKSAVSGRFVLPLSRRVSFADGSFAGVVIGTIEVAYFADIFERLNTEPNSAINLFHADGILLVRSPADSLVPGRDMAGVPSVQRFIKEEAGQFTAMSSMDGVERLYTFMRVGRWPLRVNVALGSEAVDAAWRPKAITVGLIVLVVCVGIGLLALRLNRELRRRLEAETIAQATSLELAHLANTDSLTGLSNRRQFDQALADARSRTDRSPLALLLFDTDQFKRYNDLYGHLAGDHVLKAIARILHHHALTSGASAYRIGGEEFAVILSGTDEPDAFAFAERVRLGVAAENIPHEGQNHDVVTVSGGVMHAERFPDATVEQWFATADAALYEAKRQGRNRVLVAGTGTAGTKIVDPVQGHTSTGREATPQGETRSAFQKTNKRYEALIDASASTVWRARPDGQIIDSGGWANQTGQSPDAARGDGWLDAVHPDDRERASSAWRAITISGQTGSVEYRARHVTGDYRWILARAVPLKDASGRIEEWVGVATDVHQSRQATEALRVQEERHRLAVLATQDSIWDWDLATDHIAWSEATGVLFGYADTEIADSGTWWKSKIHPDDRARVVASIYALIDGTDSRWSDEYRFLRGDDTYAEVIDRGFVIRNEAGRAVRMVGAMHDATLQREASSALRSSEERLRLALRAGRLVAWERDLRTGLATRSANSLSLLGIGSGPISLLLDQVHPADRAYVETFVAYGGTVNAVEFRYLHPSGPLMWLAMRAEQITADRVVGITFDITERKLADELAWRAANHDALTGLANRAFFQSQLEEALTRAEQSDTGVSLMLIDLDGFKDVNDTLGHDVGDAVLGEVARRLGDGLRNQDVVARLGGDEFALLLGEPLRLDHAMRFADTLIERLRQPFAYRGRTLTCKASIGVAAFPDHHRDGRELLKDADLALSRAKAAGRNCALVYVPEMRAETERRVGIIEEVRLALDAGQIVPFYQPKVCLTTGEIVGFEALARWLHPSKGLLTPGYFGAAFEDRELSIALGDCLLRQVAADMRSWQERALGFGRIAVNFASAEFRKPDLAGHVLDVLRSFDIPPASFEVEITETVFLGHGSECVPATLQRLHEAGILVTLDDFGTGYASLTHLKQFPVGHIKVDQSFVRDMEQDGDDAAIVAAVIGLGRSLGVQVTAEGIETVGQAEKLAALGCDYAQGYLYARPMIGSRVPWLLQTWTAGSTRDLHARQLSA